MSDRMTPISFGGLMTRALSEYRESGSVLGVRRLYRHSTGKTLPIFGETIETPFGPAAGPHTQLSQNLVAAYAGGSRFFELKTVQTLDGEDLPVSKPCILAREEGFNVEWSTELTVPQALDEYVSAWFAIKLLSRELGLGSDTGFVFNMSVGYDLKGIQSEKIDHFIESLMDASHTERFRECAAWTLAHLDMFEHVDEAFVRSVSPRVCRSITLSTLHGCPAGEIESIASYLISQKGLNTYVKCNPTLLGYAFARKTLDSMGYDELPFDEHHFNDDLQFADAVPMFTRLKALAVQNDVEFGLKLSNTFPVEIARGELPGNEMYMSGKGLYPLTIALAQKLETAFDGKMRVSYSGGADAFNIGEIFGCGIWPITMATTFLKPGGYNRMEPIARLLSARPYRAFDGVDLGGLASLAAASTKDKHHIKPQKPLPERKLHEVSPVLDCFVSPCERHCPIHQDITAYLDLAEAGRFDEALEMICRKNPLPFITGTICAHRCQSACTRHFYEDSIHIRDVKLLCAQKGMDAFVATLAPQAQRPERVAIVGGGPAGMAAAFFAARAGARVTLFEKRDALGGVVRHVIPSFRIGNEAVESDAKLLAKLGVEIRLNAEVESADELYRMGYTHVILAVGAWKPSFAKLEKGESVDALDFLETAMKRPQAYAGVKSVAVIGGGNTAMDAARAAKRLSGVTNVSIVYRRTTREMPADEEELDLALEDGVAFCELRSPKAFENGTLSLDVMTLGAPDESGRRSPVATGKVDELRCDLVVGAIGEKPDAAFLSRNGVTLDAREHAASEKQSERLWVIGDAFSGPATVVEAIAGARKAVDELLGLQAPEQVCAHADVAAVLSRRGDLRECESAQSEALRCQHCGEICENCVDVCPNRANVAVHIEGDARPQVVHIDAACNECGNCAAFCPYQGAPYQDKLTAFSDRKGFDSSKNQGVLSLANGHALVRLQGEVYEDDEAFSSSKAELRGLLKAARSLSEQWR